MGVGVSVMGEGVQGKERFSSDTRWLGARPASRDELTSGKRPPYLTREAQVAELVDALVSGTSGESRGGSSPLLGTMYAVAGFLTLLCQVRAFPMNPIGLR
jgi:hypothetical protein